MRSLLSLLPLFLHFGEYSNFALALSVSGGPRTATAQLGFAGSSSFRNKNKFSDENFKQNLLQLTKFPGRWYGSSSSAIFYRPHSVEDGEDAISKLRLRTSPIFKKRDLQKPEKSEAKQLPAVDKTPGINFALILSLLLNQFGILTFASGLTAFYVLFSGNGDQFLTEGILNWTGGSWTSLQNSGFNLDLPINPIRVVEGFLGAIPIIAFSSFIEKTDDRRFATTNFSTIYMVLTLFGLRSRTRSPTTSNEEVERNKFIADELDSVKTTIGKVRICDFCMRIFLLYF